MAAWLCLCAAATAASPPDPPAACPSDDPQPSIRIDGQPLPPAPSSPHSLPDRSVRLRQIHSELQLTYVHSFLSAEELHELVALADARGGWASSPLKDQREGEARNVRGAAEDERRNSSSCPMLWPVAYAARRAELAHKPGLLRELDLTTRLSNRVVSLFTSTGLPITSAHIEPLQLLRYQPTERFGPHHDYHATGKSSVQGEQRAFTFLLFGSTLPPEAGGETHFPWLNLSVSPQLGDGLVWANVDSEGEPNPRSLHEGRPPTHGEKIAINVWVTDRAFDLGNGMDNAIRSG
ncbi:hypothetical protein AB1Y20_006391 [Prymnesium parvum]|uniref:Fe2OG dioxygenase domain-containing protein n=1 Tax=Prymnesium parvum TaxID=97485 RepID=A0AB34J5R8_PRYPA